MPPSKAEAEEVMLALAKGDRAALARLIALFGPGVRRYATQALAVGSDAEDVVQEVFLRAWRKAASYDPAKGAVSTWLYRIAVNLCIDHNRRSGFRRFVGLETMEEPQDDRPNAESGIAARQELATARAAIAGLPERQRRALLLRIGAELSIPEIAVTLRTSEGAVEQLLVRARSRLRERLKEEEEETR